MRAPLAFPLSLSAWGGVFAAIGVLALFVPAVASAQQLFSFEADLQGWAATDATLVQSTTGATDGTMAMLLDDLTPGYKNDVGMTGNFNASTPGLNDAYNLLSTAGNVLAAGGNPKLEFDLTTDLSGVTANGYMQLGMFLNSNSGYKEYSTGNFIGGNALTSWPVAEGQGAADGLTLTPITANQVHVAVPLAPTLQIAGGSTFYDIGFKSNGAWEGTVDLAIDDIRLSGLPLYTEDTLFSWETPDDPGTTEINEQYEGWSEGFQAGHVHSLTATGATDGSTALQIDRQSLPSGFSWGSQFQISSDLDPDPEVEDIDPTLQAIIDDMIDRISSADSIAFDVTFDTPPILSPTYTNFAVHFTDETESFFQKAAPSFNANVTEETKLTFTIPLSEFNDPGTGNNLVTDGLMEGSNYLRIGLSTSTDGASIYQIDNIRLLALVAGTGDYNGDGVVDAADYTVWRDNLNATGTPGEVLGDGTTTGDLLGIPDGVVDEWDYSFWRAHFGESTLSGSGSADFALAQTKVPESSTLVGGLVACVGVLLFRRKGA